MKATNVALGVAAAVAAGVAIGLLVAPQEGAKMRKMIIKMPESMMDTVKYRLYQVMDLFSSAKDSANDAARKVVYKTHSMVNEEKSVN